MTQDDSADTAPDGAAPRQRALEAAAVLDHVVRVFEVGRRSGELEVNAALRAFTDDDTMLRRALVDAGMLSREAGIYWRSGGTVEL